MPKKMLKNADDQVQLLKNSPIHGLKPIGEREIKLNLIDEDPSNPGTDKFSKRYERRAPDIRESFDIIGAIVYPLVVCEKGDDSGRYTTVDGHGRLDEARRRGQKEIRVIVFPSLTLEQRICMREVLNAAQEPFDPPLVLKDLALLAKERGLDIRNENDLESLLADLPVTIRNHRKKLKLLAKWPLEVADKIGIDDNVDAGVIGLDKVKELDLLVSSIRKNHPEVSKVYRGDKLHKQVLRLYFDGTFRDGGRSQDNIRDTNRMLNKLPQDHALAKKFLKGALSVREFKAEAETDVSHQSGSKGLVGLCKDLSALLTDLDVHQLTAAERRSLKRTADLASQVLVEMPSV